MESKRDITVACVKKQAFRVPGKPVKVGDSTNDVNTIAYDPEGKNLAAGCWDGSIKIY